MQFDELRKELKNIVFITLRQESDDYLEGVISKSEIMNLAFMLDKCFGTPIWPSKTELTTEVKKFIDDFGGIMSNQTLYFCKQNNETLFAMLWPWGDGTRITVKIGKR